MAEYAPINCRQCGAAFDETGRERFGPVTVTRFACPGCGCLLSLSIEKTDRIGESGKPIWNTVFTETPAVS